MWVWCGCGCGCGVCGVWLWLQRSESPDSTAGVDYGELAALQRSSKGRLPDDKAVLVEHLAATRNYMWLRQSKEIAGWVQRVASSCRVFVCACCTCVVNLWRIVCFHVCSVCLWTCVDVRAW
jgi:hypothetical protein